QRELVLDRLAWRTRSAVLSTVPMTAPTNRIGLAVGFLCLALPLLCPWLSAHQIITSFAEFWITILCIPGVFFGALWHWGRRIRSTHKLTNALLAATMPF